MQASQHEPCQNPEITVFQDDRRFERPRAQAGRRASRQQLGNAAKGAGGKRGLRYLAALPVGVVAARPTASARFWSSSAWFSISLAAAAVELAVSASIVAAVFSIEFSVSRNWFSTDCSARGAQAASKAAVPRLASGSFISRL